MKVHVTGVAGLIGSHLARRWLELGAEVSATDNFSSGYEDNVEKAVRLYVADCCDLEAMVRTTRGADVVYHCAASPHEGLSVFSPHAITQSVFCTTVTVATACVINKVKRLVCLSSMARYGAIPVPYTEDQHPEPEDPYGIAKWASELEVALLAKVHGLEYTIAVPHNVVGIGQRYCMARGTLVKLSNGFKTIESVQAGDLVRVAGVEAPVISQFAVTTRAAVRITLENNQEVVVGREHLFRHFAGEESRWRKVSELKPGDTILAEASATDAFDRNTRDFQLGQLLGLMISDGSYNDDYQVDIACCVEEDKPDLRALLTSLGIKWGESEKGVFRICSKNFVDHLRALGFKATGADKIIPEKVLAMSHDVVAGVISGIFSGDGWVTTRQNVVGVATISEQLMRQIQKVLLSYGVYTRVARREPGEEAREIEGRIINSGPIWYVTVLSENVSRFAAIGFLYKRKQLTLHRKNDIKESSTFPGLGKRVTEIRAFLPLAVRNAGANALDNPRADITRFSLRQLCAVLENWLESDEASVCREYADFVRAKASTWRKLLAEGRPIKILAIEECEADLFDISVDSTDHSYVGDGLVCHNCDPYRNVVAIMINRCLQGKPPIIYGDGNQSRCFSNVADALDCLVKMATYDSVLGEVVNIGPDEGGVSINKLAEIVMRLTGFKGEPVRVPPRPQEVKHAYCSSEKARRLLDYRTTHTLEETVWQMVEWIKRRGPLPFDYYLPLEILSEKTPKTWTEKQF